MTFVAVYVDRIPRLQGKKVTSVSPPLLSCLSPAPPGGGDWRVSQDLSVRGSVREKMDFLHVLSERLHQRKLMPPSERKGGRVF